jgi:Tol biopolymer transport system component
VSPDGRFVARTIADPVTINPDIWLEDYDRGGRLRLTTSTSFDVMPVWSPDGREVAFRSGALFAPAIGFSPADGSGLTRALPCPRLSCEPTDWAPDGRYLVLNVGGSEVWSLPLDSQPAPAPLFTEPFPVRDARISPDGRWVSYVSGESGHAEVSVRNLAGPARRYVVSIEGGDQPVWRRDGRELFFADLTGHLHAVSVGTGADGGLVFGSPTRLDVPPLGERHWGTTYDVSRDGQVVFFPHPGPMRPPTSFGVVTGWKALLER